LAILEAVLLLLLLLLVVVLLQLLLFSSSQGLSAGRLLRVMNGLSNSGCGGGFRSVPGKPPTSQLNMLADSIECLEHKQQAHQPHVVLTHTPRTS